MNMNIIIEHELTPNSELIELIMNVHCVFKSLWRYGIDDFKYLSVFAWLTLNFFVSLNISLGPTGSKRASPPSFFRKYIWQKYIFIIFPFYYYYPFYYYLLYYDYHLIHFNHLNLKYLLALSIFKYWKILELTTYVATHLPIEMLFEILHVNDVITIILVYWYIMMY